MKKLILLPFLFYASWGGALEPLPDEALSLVAHYPQGYDAGQASSLSVKSGRTAKGQWLFYRPEYTPECDDVVRQNDDDPMHTDVCDEKEVEAIPEIILSNEEVLDGIKNVLPTRPTSYKYNGNQLIILDLNLDDNIWFTIGDDGEVVYLENVTLTNKNGETTTIGPISSRIDRGDVDNGKARLELVSEVPLDGMTLNIEKIKVLKNEHVAPNGRSMGGLTLGNITGYANSKMFYHE